MTSSLTIPAVYALLLVAVLLVPYAALPLTVRPWFDRLSGRVFCAMLLVGAVVLTGARHWEFLLLSVFLLQSLLGLGIGALLGGIAAVLLFQTVMWWWTADPILSRWPGSVFMLLALVAGFLPRWKSRVLPETGQPRLLVPMLLCGGIGLLAGLITTPFEGLDPLYTAWHHWSALLAPVEAWRGGGVPYRDFPIQYGLGPTALLRASCGADCWSGMFHVAVVTNALYFATLTGCAIILTARSSQGMRWLALAALFCACFIWTGFPIQFAGPAMTPAVAGLRFLTISALLFHILLTEQRQIRRDWIGHAIWLVDLFWSPEAGFFATVIWWPYLAMRDAAAAQNTRGAWLALVRGALRAIVALAIGVCYLVALLWWLSGGSVTLADFFAYIQHPPGMRPIKPLGAIWVALASIALAMVVLARQGLSSSARCFYACLLGFVAAGVYYLSRSHDNNILNLLPLLIPVLLAVLAGVERIDTSARGFVRGFVHTALVAMVALVTTFNFEFWQAGLARAGVNLGPAHMVARLTPTRGTQPAILSADAVAGLDYLRGRDAGMVMLFDYRRVIPRSSSGTAWTSVNNVANFEPLPGAMIVDYIQRGAASYQRPGWIMVGPGFHAWARAFQTAYDIREERAFGRYRAYHLVPRHHPIEEQAARLAMLALDRAKPKT
ncbi:hypothetical protein [Sphingobium bisphenolivorans]|uniref:hypothetical protein n=1 Tax=Sphingobium bisphenolivorans TaxID=1335760 RepID=UPI0003A50087|nr:hypothetical protein [Sphingobium bisphenolivorans]